MSEDSPVQEEVPQPGAEGDRNASSGTAQPSAFQRIISHVNSDKIEAIMWFSRIGTIFFFINYMLPLFGFGAYTSGQRVLITGAITSALRLHQRVPRFQLSYTFFQTLIAEDSAHYLLYSVIMLMAASLTYFVLLPPFLFAVLHVTKYTKTLLNLAGPDSMSLLRNLLAKVDTNQQQILRAIAGMEIILMPTSILLIISGQATLLLPFLYYRFLCLRYTSTRNPYNRDMFTQYRLGIERLTQHPRCPAFAATALRKIIEYITRMAPTPAQPNQRPQ